jgi:hypothetical protein
MRHRRRLSVTAVLAITALAGALGAGLAGCAQSGAGTSARAGSSASGPTTTGPLSGSSSGPEAGGSASACTSPRQQVTVTEADNGATVCLAVGGTLTVTLHEVDGSRWQNLTVQGEVLRTVVGRGTLQVGVTGGYYQA